MSFLKNKKLSLLIVFGVMLLSGLTVMSGRASAEDQIYYCKDGTRVKIPSSAPGGITADQACKNNGGAEPEGTSFYCEDGTRVRIPASAPGGITAEQACVNNGGVSGSENNDNDPYNNTDPIKLGDENDGDYVDQCGNGDNAVKMKFNFNCLGEEYPGELNPIIDLMFSLIRTISMGVGVLMVLLIVIAGIRFSSAQGDPQAISKAIAGIRNAVIGLLVYFLAFALLQWLVPGGVFNSTGSTLSVGITVIRGVL
jgi:hypothetical protein